MSRFACDFNFHHDMRRRAVNHALMLSAVKDRRCLRSKFRVICVARAVKPRFLTYAEQNLRRPMRSSALFHALYRFHYRRYAGFIVSSEYRISGRSNNTVFYHRLHAFSGSHCIQMRAEKNRLAFPRHSCAYVETVRAEPPAYFVAPNLQSHRLQLAFYQLTHLPFSA